MVSVEFSLNNYTRSRNENKRKKEASLKKKEKKNQKTTSRTEMVIYQWVSLAKKAFRLHWSFDSGLGIFSTIILEKQVFTFREFPSKLEILEE